MLGNTALAQTQTLIDNGDGNYTLQITLDSKLSHTDQNGNAGESRNYYYTAPFSGNYLVQVWGGNGASGSNTSYSNGGTGGAGGYVYGKIYLQAGETLYYQLGGQGEQTQEEDEGGGVNGDGGGHGDTGSLKVGGGGGYSAVYKFDALEFEKNYTDGNGNVTSEISVEDRATKYVFIAGGGGGGGAGNGMSPLLGITATGTADGGAAGSVGSASGVLSGSGYDVEGTFFAGENGKSSGTVTNFVGHGGTNVPGEINATALGSLFDLFQGKQPNDWRGTTNENYAGGSGGSGNLRGGAGGAGFCGGSGGVQAGLLSAYSVGGGGGGSSFIASNVTYTGIDEILASDGLSANPSSTGGAVHIAALDAEEHLSYLNGLTLIGTCSKYFDVTSDDSQITASETGFFASGIDLAEGGSVTLTLKLTPKAGFMGGNNVPMWESGITCATTDGSGYTAVIPVSDNCGYANVPLQNFTVNAHSHSTNVENPTYPVESSDQEAKDGLYTDDYETLREQIENGTAGWQYDFIQSIGAYYVQSEEGTAISEASVFPTVSTRYRVLLDVTPKTDSYAAVGDPVLPTTFMKYAVITITPPGAGSLFDNEFTGQKALTFDEHSETYQLTYTFDITRNVNTNALESAKPYYYDAIGSFTVPENKAGYYLIQAWGGNGGNGCANSAEAGSGGAGGYVYGVVQLSEGDTIISDTSTSQNAPNASDNSSGGLGGGYSKITLTKQGSATATTIMIAAGGGGGGNGSTSWLIPNKGGNGSACDNVNISTTLNEANNYEAYQGKPGGVGSSALIGIFGAGGAGGAAGTNYRSSTMSTDVSALTAAAQNIYNTEIAKSTNPNPNANGGSVIITCLQLDEAESANPELKDFSFGSDISRYFTVQSVAVDVGTGGTYDAPVIDHSTNQITIGNIDPAVSSVNTATGRTETAGYKVTITLKAKDGFLGGNDVPVLEYGNVDSLYETGMYVGQTVGEESETEVVVKAPATDFANVAIPDLRDYASVTAKEHTIVAGDSVDTEDMYEDVWLKPLPTDWEDEFVALTQMLTEKGSTTPITSSTVSPQVTTWYDMTLALAPKAAPVNATVITEAETQTLPCQPVIYVLPRVVYELTHLTTSETLDAASSVTIPVGEDYTATLTANTGYTLPAGITITRNDGVTLTVGDDYTYNATTGAFTVYASAIGTRQITVTATAPLKTHTLTYHYETSPGGPHLPETTPFYPNKSIESTLPFTHDPVDVDGYSYVQSWEVDGEAIEWVIAPERAARPAGVPVTMPESDVWVFGHYKPNDYTLTIHYYYEGTANPAATSHTETVTYGSAYSVTSPVVSGYLADSAVISGTMGASDTTINVYYTPTANQLNILYFKTLPDGSLEQFGSHNSTVATDISYAVTSPTLTGYTVEAGKETVSGSMSAQGVTVHVVYTPNRYTVTLGANGGTCTKDSITVAFDNVYGYVYQDGTWGYDSLPTPVRVGYDFQGWYLDGQKVTEATAVTTAADHTLTAKWKGQEFKYIIRHIYEDGTSVADGSYDISDLVAVGVPVPPESYSVPVVDGYTADRTRGELESTMVAQNVMVTITYTSNYRTLTIHYKYADTVEDTGKRGTTAAESYVEEFDIVTPDDLSYSVPSPAIPGYSASLDTVSGTMGMDDVTLTVYYYDRPPVVSVTVTWGALNYSYTHGTWSPETHTYSTELIKPDEAGKNTVTVTNNAESEIPINAQFSYAANPGYEAVDHFFTATDNMAAANITQTGALDPGEYKKSFLWLQGTLDRDKTGTVTSGICTVTITGGG